MTQLPITQPQVYYINWLLDQIHFKNPNLHKFLTNYPVVKNRFTYFLRQQRRGFVSDFTISQGANMINELKAML